VLLLSIKKAPGTGLTVKTGGNGVPKHCAIKLAAEKKEKKKRELNVLTLKKLIKLFIIQLVFYVSKKPKNFKGLRNKIRVKMLD
jgi:hypothetical protein